jgi:hypothetical protein
MTFLQLDGVLVQSDFHAKIMEEALKTWTARGRTHFSVELPFSVVPNGITDMSECVDGVHDNNVFVYARSQNT